MAGFSAVIIASAIVLFLLYPIARIIYNLYFHPLRKFPGPNLWASTNFVRHIYAVRGDMDAKMRILHSKYGSVVRYQPDGLSFIDSQAWIDIYSHGHSLPRDKNFYVFARTAAEPNDMFSAIDDAEHARIRRHVSHAFAEKSIQEMEPRIKSHVDFFIDRIKSYLAQNDAIDLNEWFKFVTFDTIGDLSLGQSFGCLEKNGLHPMVALIFNRIKSRVWFHFAEDFPFVQYLFPYTLPKQISGGRAAVGNYMEETDFMTYILKNNNEKSKLSDGEIMANARIFAVAGSETTATLLASATYCLLKHPEAYRKAEQEVREAFTHSDEISGVSASKLPYLMACIEEAMRMFPPGPTWVPRRTAKPTEICGYTVPPNISVAVHPWSAYTSETNFHLARSYIPERWLAPPADTRNPFANDKRDVLKPFSLGPRNCIGQNLARAEMRRILALLLWTFDWEICEESKNWDVGQKTFFSWERAPLMVRLKDRQI